MEEANPRERLNLPEQGLWGRRVKPLIDKRWAQWGDLRMTISPFVAGEGWNPGMSMPTLI